MTLPMIESLTAREGAPDSESTDAEWTAWALRRRLPSELVHKVVLRWPSDVKEVTDISVDTLKKQRVAGDHPRLYAIGRALFTTRDDLLAWFEAHELAPGQVVRPATIPRGSKRKPAAGLTA